MSAAPDHCGWCHRATRPIWVHGHAQCEHCGINIEPCCSGDPAGSADDALSPQPCASRLGNRGA